jgi:hypothetical protein
MNDKFISSHLNSNQTCFYSVSISALIRYKLQNRNLKYSLLSVKTPLPSVVSYLGGGKKLSMASDK